MTQTSRPRGKIRLASVCRQFGGLKDCVLTIPKSHPFSAIKDGVRATHLVVRGIQIHPTAGLILVAVTNGGGDAEDRTVEFSLEELEAFSDPED